MNCKGTKYVCVLEFDSEFDNMITWKLMKKQLQAIH